MSRVLVHPFALAVLAAAGVAQNVPTNFVVDTLVSSGLQAAHDFAFLPDGRVLFANRGGAVQVWAGNGSPVTIGTVPNVETGSERGLLSIASDPDFPTNGYVYVWWSSSLDAFMHLDRFTCTGDLANPNSTSLSFSSASRRVILDSAPDSAFNHNGGSVRFGPDGRLYLSIGDDASACTAQNTSSKRGCLLRMDVGGLGPAPGTSEPPYATLDPGDNPNSASSGFERLVIAHGLRNPFRMEIDQLTGNCYIGDVGQTTAEEYSEYVYTPGALSLVNFGWPWREGSGSGPTSCGGSAPAGMVGPIASVSSSAWDSVMGGPRYRNQGGPYDFGSSYEGDAFFLDYFSGQVRRLTFNGSWQAAAPAPGQPNGTDWGTGFVGTVSMRQGPDGGIWFLQHPSTYPNSGGSLKRIRPLGPVNSVVQVSGDGQVVAAGDPFPQPLVVQVLDPNGSPLPNGQVNFLATGPVTLSTTNPVTADANGFAQTTASSTATAGGAISVTAASPGSPNSTSFSLFARKLTATGVSNLLILSVANTTTANPPQVPYMVLMSFPGSPTLQTFLGPICTDPGYALTVALEDGVGSFGGVSFSGSGGLGTPSKSWLYQGIPPGLLTGFQMSFQAVGFDPVTGWFRTNCELEQF